MGLRGRHRARGLLAPAGVLAVAALVLLGGAALGVKGGRHHGRAAALNAPAQSSVRTARSNLDPKRVVALGAFIPGAPKDPERLVRYIRKTGQRPTIISYFRRWQHGTFDPPSLRTVTRNGAIPMITWEPWGYPLADIAAGRYDDFLRSVAAEARRWGHPILVRLAHEMNGDWYPWDSAKDPGTYVRAWRHVVSMFRYLGARNVGWVWAPNVDWGGPDLMKKLYPGDHWVDWVGLSGFSWGGPWGWQSEFDVFHNSYDTITSFTNKPFMLAETAAGEIGGDKAAWIRDTFTKDLRRLPHVHAVIWFNGRDQWARWDVDSTPKALAAFRRAVAAPRYRATPADVAAVTWKDGLRTAGDVRSTDRRG